MPDTQQKESNLIGKSTNKKKGGSKESSKTNKASAIDSTSEKNIIRVDKKGDDLDDIFGQISKKRSAKLVAELPNDSNNNSNTSESTIKTPEWDKASVVVFKKPSPPTTTGPSQPSKGKKKLNAENDDGFADSRGIKSIC
jgi:nitric oxide reductase activation protein